MIESKPIRRKRGQTSPFDITFSNNGVAMPLTGTVELFVTRESAPKSTDVPIMTLAGVIQTAPADNVVRFTPTPTDADNLGFFFYEVKNTAAGGAVRPILEGPFIIEETRAH